MKISHGCEDCLKMAIGQEIGARFVRKSSQGNPKELNRPDTQKIERAQGSKTGMIQVENVPN